MDNWTTFPDLFEQFLTDQQPPAYPFGHPLSHEFDRGNELASHDSISAQQATNLFESLNPLSFAQEHLVPVPQNTGIVSTNDAELTAAAMGPPPKRRKKKAPTLRAKDWEPYKARILELHDAQKLPLAKVKEMIEEEFGFSAELRQYRTRITQWGKDKNIKPAEMTAIVRKRQQRRLVEVDKGEQIFSIRGRNVEPHKIDRWMARHEVSQTSLYAPSPVASTPSAIICRTISERGSVALSPAHSTRSLDFSPRGTISITPRSRTPSPVTFMPDMGHHQNGVFNIQGHTHAYQPYSTIPLVRQLSPSDIVPPGQPPRRYNQSEEEAIKGALSVAETSFGTYHSRTLKLRVYLASIMCEQGRFRHAEEVTRRVVEDCENNENALIIKFDASQLLSVALRIQGFYHQSQKLQEWLMEWGKVDLGKEHPSIVYCMIELSWGYVWGGNLKKGEELGAQALKISKEVFGESHHITMHAMYTLVYTYIKQGRLNEAEELGLQLLTKTMTMLGDRHPFTIGCMSRLALVYSEQGRSNEAGELLRQALEMSVHSYGDDHPVTIYRRDFLAEIYQGQGRLEEAKGLGEQALMAAQRVLGKQHPQTIEHMAVLVKIYKDQGQIEKAEALEQQRQELERHKERQEEDLDLNFSFTNFMQTSGRRMDGLRK